MLARAQVHEWSQLKRLHGMQGSNLDCQCRDVRDWCSLETMPSTQGLTSAAPRVPNWAIAAGLGLAAVGTYYYTLHAVGTTDIDAEVRKVQDAQQAESKPRQK